jgi:anion-transporting  ArsA/GET3 family ATPase
VGGEVIADAIAFFVAFEGMDEGFKERARRVEALLAADETAFVLVASPKGDAVAEATFFAGKLTEHRIDVRALIVNRMHPDPGPGSAEADRQRAATLAGTDIGDLYTCLADLRDIAHSEEVHLADLTRWVDPAPVCRVPFLPFEVIDLPSLGAFGDALFGRRTGWTDRPN